MEGDTEDLTVQGSKWGEFQLIGKKFWGKIKEKSFRKRIGS